MMACFTSSSKTNSTPETTTPSPSALFRKVLSPVSSHAPSNICVYTRTEQSSKETFTIPHHIFILISLRQFAHYKVRCMNIARQLKETVQKTARMQVNENVRITYYYLHHTSSSLLLTSSIDSLSRTAAFEHEIISLASAL